jgi:4-hydroxybenzoate polyprenyltransferase
MNRPNQFIPICVDLDGTLIYTDLLLETLLLLIKRNPFYLLLLPFWLLKGKAALKSEIAKRVTLNPAALPYNKEFLMWLQSKREEGFNLWLCTASNDRLGSLVAEYLHIFNGVMASTDETNLSGRVKAKRLVEEFGEKQFAYCGNNHIDLIVWRVSQLAVVVNGSESLTKKTQGLVRIWATFPMKTGFFGSIFRALRVHQWIKNILVLIPLVLAHKLGDISSVQNAIQAFIVFSFCASSVYILNDMLDLEVDRMHPRKCKRPFASGDLSLLVGMALAPALILCAVLLSTGLPVMFWVVLAAYYTLTLSYSFVLKRIVLIDTISLAGLYTIRLIAGAMAINVALSFWLLVFSLFLFLSLALVKRYSELDVMQRQGKLKAAGRGYHVNDLPILHTMGVASGYMCVLVMALYINSPIVKSLYHYPQVIWLLTILILFWISRVWLVTYRGEMHDDPIIFALKDRASLVVFLLVIFTMMVAL